MYRLFRLNDGFQFIGNVGNPPIIGSVSRVSKYDDSPEHWATGTVLEILDRTERRIVFRTKSSIYVWEDII